MTDSNDLIKVHANVDITSISLQAIVKNAKELAGRDGKGIYRVDTADVVSEMITNFLSEKDFQSYSQNIDNMKNKHS